MLVSNSNIIVLQRDKGNETPDSDLKSPGNLDSEDQFDSLGQQVYEFGNNDDDDETASFKR